MREDWGNGTTTCSSQHHKGYRPMIVRGPRPADRFAQIHNGALEDGELSFKARGILSYLLSRPPGWTTSAERLAAMGRDGDRAIRSGLKELEARGYLQRSRRNDPATGKWVHEQVVTDQPAEKIEPIDDTILPKQPDGDTTRRLCTRGEQPDINNTDSNNTLFPSDVVVSPTVSAPAGESPPPSRQLQRVAPRGWQPSERALATAYETAELVDVQLHLTRYRVVCAEKRKTPTEPEWLRYLIEDEKQARNAERQNANSERKARPWYNVAE